MCSKGGRLKQGSVKEISHFGMQNLERMKLASNGGLLNCGLQVFYVHVLLVVPLRAPHIRSRAQTNIRAKFPSAKLPTTRVTSVDLPFQALIDIVGTDASPVFAPSPHFLSSLFQLHGAHTISQPRPWPPL